MLTPASPVTRRRMLATPGRDNAMERSLRSALRLRGLRFRLHVPVPQTRRTIDIAFARARVAVFVDGCFWHGCPLHGTAPKKNAAWWREKLAANQQRDMDTVERLTKLEWAVIRIWEHEDIDAAASQIEEQVRARTGSGPNERKRRPDDTEGRP